MGLFALDITETMATGLRLLAAVIGFGVGWFATKPLANVLSNLAFQRSVSPKLMPWIRLLGAGGLAVLLYFVVPVGGYGPGPGGGPGGGGSKDKDKEKRNGDGKIIGDAVKDKRDSTDKEGSAKDKTPVDLIKVEILGGKRYPGGNRWYLMYGTDTAVTNAGLKEAIQKHLSDNKLKTARLQPVITAHSFDNWRSVLLPEIEHLRKELNLTPVDPDESALK